jgi:tRNA pseudouridine32 synthase/23S rRNA pseudouridine746 synthase
VTIPITEDPLFTPLSQPVAISVLPDQFMVSKEAEPHPLCRMAAEDLQLHLRNQQEWVHNFGLSPATDEGTIIGKMFGVLVVERNQHEIGYLAAFSGKLAGGNHHLKFVPPVFDGLSDQSFLNNGMRELTRINSEIEKLELGKPGEFEEQIRQLKVLRKNNSIALQNQLFDSYHFLNQDGEGKSLNEIFKSARRKNPPSGAGECAAPKLLQYAFLHNLKPIALAEFWWGQSPKSDFWKHGQFYTPCREKCEPILSHMLS